MGTFNDIIQGEQVVLVDFFATWCGPCKTMDPIIKEIAAEFGSKLRILKVDIDKNPSAAAHYNVRGVPTFILFQKGTSIWRASGALPKMELQKIDRHMLTLSFNATNVKSLGKHIFMRNTLGINGEYDFLPVYHTSGAPLAIEQHYPGRFLFQTHYKFGIGFHLNNRVIMLPSIETPILSIYEFDDFKSSMLIFNSRYRPVLFKVQFLVLDKRPNRKCPSKGTNRRSRESLFGMIDGKRPW